jgi:predicted DCC family thiol-disulfide oxidoreductase YuxK
VTLPVVIFDDHCLVCARGVRFILAHEREPALRFASSRGVYASNVARRHGMDPAKYDETFVVVLEDGSGVEKLLVRSDAAIMIAALLRWPWRALGIVRILPRGFRDAMYDAVARNRMAISRWLWRRPSKTQGDACVLDPSFPRHRLIED